MVKMDRDTLDSSLQEILDHIERRRKEIPADFYSLVRTPNLFMFTQRVRVLLKLLRQQGLIPLAKRRILEVGCGEGSWLVYLMLWGATPDLMSGIDLDQQALKQAMRRLPEADLRFGNAADLPWADHSFDIVLQMTAFSTMLDGRLRQDAAREMMRVVKPDGVIIWYDLRFDNPKNPSIRPVKAREIKEMFPGCSVKLKRVTLVPPLMRWIVPVSWILALLLEKIPPLRSHLLGRIRPPQTANSTTGSKSSPVGSSVTRIP
jgi:SAM-dependent methyltransferase